MPSIFRPTPRVSRPYFMFSCIGGASHISSSACLHVSSPSSFSYLASLACSLSGRLIHAARPHVLPVAPVTSVCIPPASILCIIASFSCILAAFPLHLLGVPAEPSRHVRYIRPASVHMPKHWGMSRRQVFPEISRKF